MNKLLFIFSILCICSYIYCYQVYDLTSKGQNEVYGYEGECIFVYWVEVRDLNGLGLPVTKKVLGSIESNFELVNLEGDSFIFKVDVRFSLNSFGNLTLVLDGTQYYSNITYSCNRVPYPLQVINSPIPWREYDQFQFKYYAQYQVNLQKRVSDDSSLLMESRYPFKCSYYISKIPYITLICSLEYNFNYNDNNNNVSVNEITLDFTDEMNQVSTIVVNSFISVFDKLPSINTPTDYKCSISPDGLRHEFTQFYRKIEVNNYEGGYYIGSLSQEELQMIELMKLVYGNRNSKTILYSFNYQSLQSQSTTFQFLSVFFRNTNQFHIISNLSMTIQRKTNEPEENTDFQMVQYSSNSSLLHIFNYLGNFQFRPINSKSLIQFGNDYTVEMVESTFQGNFYSRQIEIPLIISKYNQVIEINGQYTIPIDNFTLTDTIAPTITSIEFIQLQQYSNMMMLVKVTANDNESGVYKIEIGDEIQLYSSDLVTGTLQNGTFEKLVNYTKFQNFHISTSKIYDLTGNLNRNYQNIPKLPKTNLNSYNFTDITIGNIHFLINDVDLTLIECKNRLYVNFSSSMGSEINKELVIRLVLFIDSNDGESYNQDNVYYGTWNEIEEMFTVDFTLQPRLFTGLIRYVIFYPGDLVFYSNDLVRDIEYSQSQLRVHSNFADRMPPLISSLVAFPDINNNFTVSTTIGWDIILSDSINEMGFKSGIVSITSDLQIQIWNFTLSPSNQFKIEIPIELPCLHQVYYISYIELIGNNNVKSIFDNGFTPIGYVSPLMYIMDTYQNSISVDCPIPDDLDTSKPTLTYFSVNTNEIDTSSPIESRELIVNFTIQDNIGIRNTILPLCHVTALMANQITVTSSITIANNYSCIFTLPYGFGYPSDIIAISISSYSDVYSNIGGSSPFSISPSLGNPFVTVKFTQSIPFIENVNYNKKESSIEIYGKNFKSSQNLQILLNGNNSLVYQPIFMYNSQSILGVTFIPKNIFNEPFTITLLYGDDEHSNTFIIVPSTSSPTDNKPIPPKCEGEPVCGGPENGECTDTGCKCKGNWVGLDCKSMILLKLNQKLSTNSPNVILRSDISENNQIAQLHSLISIESLNEYTSNDILVKKHQFYEWIFTNITTSDDITTYQYKSNLDFRNQLTNMVVTLNYFKETKLQYFANSKLELPMSTLKYKIDISSYPFQSNTNYLEIIMSTSISQNSSISDNEICYSNEYGTIGTQANFLKVQANSHSLIGRFINIAIIDNRVTTISNIHLKDYEADKDSESLTQLKEYIGIKIPWYYSNVQIDPDFRMLVETTPASEKSNVICNSNSKKSSNSLTSTQLAGIIIGGFCFLISIALIVVYIKLKYHKDKKMWDTVTNKLAGY